MVLAPMPFSDPIAVRREKDRNGRTIEIFSFCTEPWVKSFQEQADRVETSPQRRAAVSLEDQGAAIAATSIPISGLTSGVYRLSYIARITRAASTSSSLTVTLQWTHGGVSISQAGAAITGNTTATQQNAHLLIYADQGTPIRYSTAYASVGATSMQYALIVIAEAVNV